MASPGKKQEKKNPKIKKAADFETLAGQALEVFVNDAGKALAEKGVFYVALSGGHTPERFFELIAESPRSRELDWKKIHIFWVDERFVPPDTEASNYNLAAHTFLDKVGVPGSNVHRMSGEECDYSKAVDQYEQTIREVFGIEKGQFPSFDLIVLGMGADGHIGSLFPNSYALIDTEDLVTTVYLMDGDYNRLTLTHPVMCNAAHLMILISGPEKAQIVKEVMENEPDELKYPAHTLWPILDKVTWVIDQDAARLLET